MADTFSMDPTTVAQFAAEAEKAKAATGQLRNYAAEIDTILTNSDKSFESMVDLANKLRLDPSFISALTDVKGSMHQMGSSLKGIIKQHDLTTKSAQSTNKALKTQHAILRAIQSVSKQLGMESQRRARIDETAAEKAAEREADAEKKKEQEKQHNRYLARQMRDVSSTMAQQAGLGGIMVRHNKTLELSFAGVLKKVIELYNQSEKIDAYAISTAAQFKSGGASIGVARSAAKKLREEFTMSWEEAGQITTNMARAGVEAKDFMGWSHKVEMGLSKQRDLSSDMVAMQHVHGRALETQLTNIMSLRNNFNMYVSDAQKLDMIMADIGAKIPGLSPEQAVQDIRQMAVGMRYFNSNVLDSITLYKTLMRDAETYRNRIAEAEAMKEYAIKHGTAVPGISAGAATGDLAPFGAEILSLPLEQLQQFIQWITSQPMRMTHEQEMMLGQMSPMAAGVSDPTEWALIFRKEMENAGAAAPIKMMELMTKFFDKNFGGLKGSQRQMAFEKMSMGFGAPEYAAKRLSGAFAGGKLNAEFYSKLETSLKQNAEELKSSKDAAKQRDRIFNELNKNGKTIANSLVSLDKWLSAKINDILIKPILLVKDAVENLSNIFSGWSETTAETEMKNRMKEAPQWVRERLEKLDTRFTGVGASKEESAKKILGMMSGKMSLKDYEELVAKDPELAKYFGQTPGIKKLQEDAAKKKAEEQILLAKTRAIKEGNLDNPLITRAAAEINAGIAARRSKQQNQAAKVANDAAAERQAETVVKQKDNPNAQTVRQKNNGVQ